MSTIYEALKRINPKTGPEGDKPAPPKRSKPKLFLLIYGICALVMIVLIYSLTVKNSRGPAGAKTPQKPASVLRAPIPLSKSSETRLISEEPSPVPVKKLPYFSITGIFFSDGEYIALINDQTVKVGDSIEGAQIQKIESSGVEVEFQGSSFRISYP